MKNDYFSQLLAKPDAIVKDAEGFKTVIFNETIDAETITVSVSKADAADLLTFRVIKFCNNAMDFITKCNEYNSHSSGIIAFVTKDKLVTSLSVVCTTAEVAAEITGRLLAVLYLVQYK